MFNEKTVPIKFFQYCSILLSGDALVVIKDENSHNSRRSALKQCINKTEQQFLKSVFFYEKQYKMDFSNFLRPIPHPGAMW